MSDPKYWEKNGGFVVAYTLENGELAFLTDDASYSYNPNDALFVKNYAIANTLKDTPILSLKAEIRKKAQVKFVSIGMKVYE